MGNFKHNTKQREKYNKLPLYPSPAFKNYQLTVNCVSLIAP